MVGRRPSRYSPLHQKPNSHAIKTAICRSHDTLPEPGPVNSHPAAEMIECISRNGMAMIRKNSSKSMVICNATPLAVGLIVLEISHSMSSASTAASAIVEEKVNAAIRLTAGREAERGRGEALLFGEDVSPERIGKSLCRTRIETRRKVAMKGREENAIAVGACIVPPGRHSSQPSPARSIGRPSTNSDKSHRMHELFCKIVSPMVP